MKIEDLTIEVRNRDLVRIGSIQPTDLNFEYTGLFNNVGSWKLDLPVEHPLTEDLRSPGAGIVVTGPDGKVIASGPTTQPEKAQSPADPRGTVSVTGITDDHVLIDALAYPQPSNGDATSQLNARDMRNTNAERLLHEFVDANIGPLAPANRRKYNLVMGPNLNRGPVVAKGARFPVIGELLAEIAAPHNLGFRVIQDDLDLRFETFVIEDRTREVRLNVETGHLASQRVATMAPGVTRVVVAGQDEGVDRQFLTADTPESLLAEAQWGRRIERFVDQRQTDDMQELQQAADEILAAEGKTGLTVQVVPTETSTMVFGKDWFLGDRITVVVDDQEVASTVTGVVLKIGPEGLRTGALIGDPAGYDPTALLQRRLLTAERRLSNLERSEAPAPTGESGASAVFYFTDAGDPQTVWEIPHFFNQLNVRLQAFNEAGTEIIGNPAYIDTNNASLTWFYPTLGSVRVSTT